MPAFLHPQRNESGLVRRGRRQGESGRGFYTHGEGERLRPKVSARALAKAAGVNEVTVRMIAQELVDMLEGLR